MVEVHTSVLGRLDIALGEAKKLSVREGEKVDDETQRAPYVLMCLKSFSDALKDKDLSKNDCKSITKIMLEIWKNDNFFSSKVSGERYYVIGMVSKIDLNSDYKDWAISIIEIQIDKERAAIESAGNIGGKVGEIINGI